MPLFVLDTNAIIYYSQDELAASAFLQSLFESEVELYIPTVVVAELFSINLDPENRTILEIALSTGQIIPFYEVMARRTGEIRRDHRLAFADAAIAATALTLGATLITRNVRDFKKIPDLIIQPI